MSHRDRRSALTPGARAMTSVPAKLANGTSSAPDSQSRAPSQPFRGGCPYADVQPLATKPARPSPRPSPPSRTPSASSPTPKSEPNAKSPFQPVRRGQKPPPKEKVPIRPPAPSNPPHRQSSDSRTRRLSVLLPPVVPSAASARAAQNSHAPTLSFTDPPFYPERRIAYPRKPDVVNVDADHISPRADSHVAKPSKPPRTNLKSLPPNHSTSQPSTHWHRDEPSRQSPEVPPKPTKPTVRPTLRSTPLPSCVRKPPPPSDVDPICVDIAQPNTHVQRPSKPHPPDNPSSHSPSPQRPPPSQMPRRASLPEPPQPVTKRRRTTSSVPRNNGSFPRRSSGRIRDKLALSEPTQVQFVHDSRRRASTRHGPPPEQRSLPTSHATRRPRPVMPSAADDTVTVVPTTNTKPQQVIRCFNWQVAACDKHNASSVLQVMLREQPKYIDLSFLGLSDADVRSLLEQTFPPISKGGRHIELNNNRLQRLTDFLFGSLCLLKVISLTLSCNKLKDIHPSISLCEELRILELSRNELTAIPEEIVGLKNIECLSLSYNRITKLPPSFKELRKLKILNVAHNKLECLPDDVAQSGSVLTALDVSHNPSFNFLPKSCENWAVLEDLMLQGTQLHGNLSRKELGLSATRLVKEIAGRPFNSSRPKVRRKRQVRNRNALETNVEALDDDNVVSVP